MHSQMRKHILILLLAFISNIIAFAEQRDTIKKNDLTLVFVNTEPSFSLVTKQRLIDAFFIVYPQEIKEYNKNSLKLVTFIIDTAYKGVAATSNGVVRFNPTLYVKNP